ncbi:MAG: DUF2357 domain-containing protein [Proteobacteria bacterium]|nr:DUF2357 domain-containing protein [Pseudomonadota bacterium]
MAMAADVEAQLHLWPWSTEVPGQTKDLVEGESKYPFYGSPVVSLSKKAEFWHPRRHEKYYSFGPPFTSEVEHYQLYEIPHAVPAGKEQQKNAGCLCKRSQLGAKDLRLSPENGRERTIPGKDGKQHETLLARTVLSWSQLFDDLLDQALERHREPRLPWDEFEETLTKLKDQANQPRKALILNIAETLQTRLAIVVSSARKVLLRERRMMPAGRVSETDVACLEWYLRQPGITAAQKAAANRQTLMGVARRESWDTHENRILKDFLSLCRKESTRYLLAEVGNNPNFQKSERAEKITAFRYLCADLLRQPFFESVSRPEPGLRPNYVLQNDHRYREIWKLYLRLLRQEDEEDILWDWQARTWADVVRLLVGRALHTMAKKRSETGTGIFQEILKSSLHLFREQRLGARVQPGCEPGPFILYPDDPVKQAVMEVVHSSLAEKHPVAKSLGRLGAHLYLVIHPFGPSRTKVIAVWAVHTAGTWCCPSWEEIARSAREALDWHRPILGGRAANSPDLYGLIAASDLESMGSCAFSGDEHKLPLVQITADQSGWSDANVWLEAAIEEILGGIM